MDSTQVRQLKMTGLFVWEQVNRLAGSWSLMSFVCAPRQHFLRLVSCPRHSCDVKGLKATSMICLALPWVYGNGLKCCVSFTPLSPWGTSTSGGEYAGQQCGETSGCSLPGWPVLVMPWEGWSRGAADRDIRAVGCGQSTKQCTAEPHCRTILGVNLKLVTKLARLAGAALVQSKATEDSSLNWECCGLHVMLQCHCSLPNLTHLTPLCISGQGASGHQANPKPDFCNWAVWEVPYPPLQEVKGNAKQRSSVTWTWWNSGISGMEGCC